MEKVRLGKTELYVSKTAFGALPIQRRSTEDAVKLVRRAFDCGITFFDTANAYTDSEYKLGLALHDVRKEVILATKSAGTDKATVAAHIDNSLRALQTDHIDLFQFHNPAKLPDPADENGPWAAVREAKASGKILHVGITNHRYSNALLAIESGLYETIMFPFSYLSEGHDLDVMRSAIARDLGFIAMKALAGGLLNDSRACYAFMRQFPSVVPIYGIQREAELEEWLALSEEDPPLTPELEEIIKRDKQQLTGSFCHSCGYCLPCAAGIDIPQAARMWALLRRVPYQKFMTDAWYKKMQKINECIHCNACVRRCPYSLNTPELLAYNLVEYNRFYREHHTEAN